MSTRIYRIKPKPRASDEVPPPQIRLVRAMSAAHALRHVASDFIVGVPTQDELVNAVAAGVVVEDAAAQEPTA